MKLLKRLKTDPYCDGQFDKDMIYNNVVLLTAALTKLTVAATHYLCDKTILTANSKQFLKEDK